MPLADEFGIVRYAHQCCPPHRLMIRGDGVIEAHPSSIDNLMEAPAPESERTNRRQDGAHRADGFGSHLFMPGEILIVLASGCSGLFCILWTNFGQVLGGSFTRWKAERLEASDVWMPLNRSEARNKIVPEAVDAV